MKELGKPMDVTAFTMLACPLDGGLLDGAPSLRCEKGHTFDRAREGYWNLLLVQHKASRNPGDSKEMVAARRRVHDAGLYAPVAAKTFEFVSRLIADRGGEGAFRVLDAGCGEGYYLERLAAAAIASNEGGAIELAGTDVSKPAVQMAAKRKLPAGAGITWAVANNRHLPFAAGSVDLIVSMFGFAVWDGFKPVQAPGGRVLLVDPGPDHLMELREIIYPAVKRSPPPSLAAAMAAGYVVESVESLRFTAEVGDGALVQDLIAMTPHATRMPAAGREALAAVGRIDVTMDVVFRMVRLSA